jgi:hypothetical protein
MKRPALHIHTTHTRDAALLRLRRINRWLIFGSILLTGVLADVAANAFPGHKKAASTKARAGSHRKERPTGVLAPPEQSPERAAESSSGQGESDQPSESSTGEGSSSGESSGGESRAPETAPESTQQEAPSESSESSGESSGPVVSGGS